MAIFRPKPSQIFLFGLVPNSPVHIGLIYVKNPKPNISCLGPFKPTQARIKRRKDVNGSVNSEGDLKCPQKPNTARKTVPLSVNFSASKWPETLPIATSRTWTELAKRYAA